MSYQPRVMLVTGGAGFIGSNFIRYILKTEPEIVIINLDKLTYAGNLTNLEALPNASQHHFIKEDIRNTKRVKNLFSHYSIDTVVHFAAESHVDRSIAAPNAFIESNVSGTFSLLEAARDYWLEKNHCESNVLFHHISTDEVYGTLNLEDPAFTEYSTYHPRSPYSASKAGADHLVQAYHSTYGLPTTISRCSNNYGPYQHSEKFIPTIIRSCLQHVTIPVYGNGKNIRDWIYVKDHCRGILEIIKHGTRGSSYNMGGGYELENIQLADLICKKLDGHIPHTFSYSSLIEFVTDRKGHDFRYAIDTTKIQNDLKWFPQETFDSGIEKTILFYLNKQKL